MVIAESELVRLNKMFRREPMNTCKVELADDIQINDETYSSREEMETFCEKYGYKLIAFEYAQ
jgi:hypothetical protein